MKYYFLLFLSVLFISCNDDSPPSYETEDDIIAYLDENNITANRTETGLHYLVKTEGNGRTPVENEKVTFTYKLHLLDGSVVEETKTEGITSLLEKLIPGLAEGINFFDEGSEGTIYIPPSLGFGFYDRNNVPAGSVLIFDIKILKIATPEEEILAYLAENELEAQKSVTGLYYIINKQGDGAAPTADSNVTVSYKGYFTNGTVFDQNANGIAFDLSQVIEGWKEGMTYFNEGGEGILLVPPTLGYGYTDRPGIPAGSVLIFEVKLVKINN